MIQRAGSGDDHCGCSAPVLFALGRAAVLKVEEELRVAELGNDSETLDGIPK